MKYTFALVLSLLLFVSCQQQKIGYVNNGDVINELLEKKDIEKKYQDKDKAFQAKRDSMVNAFQMEIKEAQVKIKKMSPKAIQELSMEFQKKEELLGQKIQTEQQQLEKAFQSDIDSLIVKVKNHIANYGKQNGYDYILGTSDAAASVLYGKDEMNLTEIIRKELDEAYKAKK